VLPGLIKPESCGIALQLKYLDVGIYNNSGWIKIAMNFNKFQQRDDSKQRLRTS
jgi:hypothetical protein